MHVQLAPRKVPIEDLRETNVNLGLLVWRLLNKTPQFGFSTWVHVASTSSKSCLYREVSLNQRKVTRGMSLPRVLEFCQSRDAQREVNRQSGSW